MSKRRNASTIGNSRNPGFATESQSFIPLKDLLRKNHADRVQDYLDKMDEENGTDEEEQQNMKETTNSRLKLGFNDNKKVSEVKSKFDKKGKSVAPQTNLPKMHKNNASL